MPTIATETIYFDGAEYRLRYSVSNKGQFYLNLPESMYKKLGIDPKITDDTLDKVKKEWARLHKMYLEASTSTIKVIAYQSENIRRTHQGRGRKLRMEATSYHA